MGDLRNCPVCGKVFVKINRNLCPDCIDKEEQEFEEVRKYLKDNPGASVMEIAEVTSVDENKILKWMREGRIDVTFTGGVGLNCKRCGVQITAGNLCAKCAKALANQFKTISTTPAAKPEEPEKNKDPKAKGMFVAERLREDE